MHAIIPYQVITGNYNHTAFCSCSETIIPYQVITGNYNTHGEKRFGQNIIPYQVITGNYNSGRVTGLKGGDYTIPSDNRELQHPLYPVTLENNYTIPSDNRELQL